MRLITDDKRGGNIQEVDCVNKDLNESSGLNQRVAELEISFDFLSRLI